MAGCCAHQVKIAYKVESLFAGSLSENVYRYLKRPFQGSIAITGFSFERLVVLKFGQILSTSGPNVVLILPDFIKNIAKNCKTIKIPRILGQASLVVSISIILCLR